VTSTIDALWLAVEAAPGDAGLRGLLSDAYRDEGDEDTADAVMATADKWPSMNPVDWNKCEWDWHGMKRRLRDGHFRLRRSVYEKLSGERHEYLDSTTGEIVVYGISYHSFRDAMTDLLRAWVAVNRAGVRV
jgi:hypothetical protein